MRKLIIIGMAVVFILPTLACGTTPTPDDIPAPPPTATYTPEPPTATPTNTPEPFVGGDCDPSSDRIEMDASFTIHITGGSYPESCPMYCLWVPQGRQLEIGLTGFTINLDFYVDVNLSVADYSDFGQWYAHSASETGTEEVAINNPNGRYYIQVCAYSSSWSDETDATFYNNFTP